MSAAGWPMIDDPDDGATRSTPGVIAPWPAIAVTPSPSTDLPLPPDALIGRDAEVAALVAMVSPKEPSGARLVTLTGPGGVGKTRLALEAATRLAGEFDEGARLLSLGAVTDPDHLGSLIARATGVSATATQRFSPAVVSRALGDRSLLLVLDTFEHLLAGASVIANVLQHGSRLRILVTSRARLGIRGEREFPVLPLLTVAGEAGLPPAARLFEDRARAVRPGFTVTPTTAPIVTEICRRVDGLPLAIELAAAWLRVLSPERLLSRLDDPLTILENGPADLPDRHRTLRATIAASFDLLSPLERLVAARFSVFAGGASLPVVEQVCLDSSGGADSGLAHLARLIDHSVLRRDDDPDGSERLTMLGTVREFAVELVATAGEMDETRRRHAHAFLDVARAAEPELTGANQRSCLDRLDRDLANLRVALSWFAEHGDAASGLDLAAALWQVWYTRGLVAEGQRWLSQFLEAPHQTAADGDRVRLANGMTAAGALAQAQGDGPTARRWLNTALELLETAPAPNAIAARARLFRGLVAFDEERWPDARADAQVALTSARSNDQRWVVGVALMLLGLVALRERRHVQAADRLREAREAFETLGNPWGAATALGVTGVVALDQGDIPRALNALHDALTRFRDLGDRWGLATFLDPIGRAAVATGQMRLAAVLFAAVDRLHMVNGSAILRTYRAGYDSNVATVRATLGEETFARVWAEGHDLSPVAAVATARQVAQSAGKDHEPGLPAHSPTSAPNAGLIASLSAREVDVLRLVAEGRTDREIASALFIGAKTVETHVSRILRKLSVPSRAAAAAQAGRAGL